MCLPRMTTRRWMIVVAVVSLLMGAIVLTLRRRAYLLSRNQYHVQRLDILRRSHRTGSINWSELTRRRKFAKYHDDMAGKYSLAARYPWLFVEPDPPEPEWVPYR